MYWESLNSFGVQQTLIQRTLSYVQFEHKAIVFKIWLVLVLYWLLWSTTQKCNCPKSIDFFSALFKSLPDWSLHEINLLSWSSLSYYALSGVQCANYWVSISSVLQLFEKPARKNNCWQRLTSISDNHTVLSLESNVLTIRAPCNPVFSKDLENQPEKITAGKCLTTLSK